MLPGCALVLGCVVLEGRGRALFSGSPLPRGGGPGLGAQPGSSTKSGTGTWGQGPSCCVAVRPALWSRRSICFGAFKPVWSKSLALRMLASLQRVQPSWSGAPSPGTSCPWDLPPKEPPAKGLFAGQGTGSQSQATRARVDPGSPPHAHPLAVGLGPLGPPGGGALVTEEQEGQQVTKESPCSSLSPWDPHLPLSGIPALATSLSLPTGSVTLDLLCSGDEALASLAPAGGALWADFKGLLGAVGRHGSPTGKSPDARTRDDPQDAVHKPSPDLCSHLRNGPVLFSLLGLECVGSGGLHSIRTFPACSGNVWSLASSLCPPTPPPSTAKAAPTSAPLGSGLLWAVLGRDRTRCSLEELHFLDWPCVFEGLPRPWRWGRCRVQTARQPRIAARLGEVALDRTGSLGRQAGNSGEGLVG